MADKQKTYTIELTGEELLVVSAIMLMHSTGFQVPIHKDHYEKIHAVSERLSMMNIGAIIERATK